MSDRYSGSPPQPTSPLWLALPNSEPTTTQKHQFYGGQPPAFPDYLQQVQALSRADGSTGWCVNLASILATIA